MEEYLFKEINGTMHLVGVDTIDSARDRDKDTNAEYEAQGKTSENPAYYTDLYTSRTDGQALYVPDIHTAAADALSGDRTGTHSADDGIIDTLDYRNLIPNGSYMVEETVVFAKDFTDADGVKHKKGEEITRTNKTVIEWITNADEQKAVFTTPEGQNYVPQSGSVTLNQYGIDSSKYADADVAVIEKLYRVRIGWPIAATTKLGDAIVTHNPLEETYDDETGTWASGTDEAEITHYVDVGTTAADGDTKDHVGKVELGDNGEAVITDTVSLINVLPGKTYTLKGKLVYRTALTDDRISVTSGSFADGESFVYDVTGTQLHTGSNANTFTISEGDGTDLSNYDISREYGTLTVTPRTVILESASAMKTYDGTPLTAHEMTVSGDGFADGESLACTYTGTQTEAGSSGNTFTYEAGGGTDFSDYEITMRFGTLTVTEDVPVTPEPDHPQDEKQKDVPSKPKTAAKKTGRTQLPENPTSVTTNMLTLRTESVQTGDMSNIPAAGFSMFGSALAIVEMLRRKKKKR